MPRISNTLKDIRVLYAALPATVGILVNLVLPAIPITPLLLPLVVLMLLAFCVFAFFWARSFSSDVEQGAVGNARLRNYAIGAFITGVVSVAGYIAFATYFNERNPQSLVLNRVVDVAQAALYALPWAFWSAAWVLIGSRKKHGAR